MEKIDKEKLIKKEKSRIKRLLKDLPEDKKKLADGLIAQAAFMRVTLEELQDIMNTDGPVELFEQGAQRMLREHPAAKTYNTMVRNYVAVCKAMFALLPEEQKEVAADELMEFIKGVAR